MNCESLRSLRFSPVQTAGGLLDCPGCCGCALQGCTGSAVTALVLRLLHANPLQETLYSCSQMHSATGATSRHSAGSSLICDSERICNAACSTSPKLHCCCLVMQSGNSAAPP